MVPPATLLIELDHETEVVKTHAAKVAKTLVEPAKTPTIPVSHAKRNEIECTS